jgi:hypothetical protein
MAGHSPRLTQTPDRVASSSLDRGCPSGSTSVHWGPLQAPYECGVGSSPRKRLSTFPQAVPVRPAPVVGIPELDVIVLPAADMARRVGAGRWFGQRVIAATRAGEPIAIHHPRSVGRGGRGRRGCARYWDREPPHCPIKTYESNGRAIAAGPRPRPQLPLPIEVAIRAHRARGGTRPCDLTRARWTTLHRESGKSVVARR